MQPKRLRQVRRVRRHTVIDVINGKPRLRPECIYTRVWRMQVSIEMLPPAEEDNDD